MRVPLLAAALAVLALASPASAATFDVTKEDDDTTCTPGNCSLRGAIIAANANPDADTINVPAGTYTLEIGSTDEDDAADGDLDIRAPVTILGAGTSATTVSAGGGEGVDDRVFDVGRQGGNPVAVTISDLHVTGGRAPGSGGGVRNDAANLTLQRVLITDGFGFRGGGVMQDGDSTLLRVLDSTVAANHAVEGGGISSEGSEHSTTTDVGVVVERTTITDNRADLPFEGDPDGGGISLSGSGDFHVRNSTIANNSVADGIQDDASAGGVYANGGHLELTNTTITGNTAPDYAAGIFNFDADVTLVNVTLADNEVPTVSGEVAAAALDPGQPGANLDTFGSSTTTFENTIVSGGSPQNCKSSGAATIVSNGHNLEDQDTCGFTATGDVRDTDPQLGPLASNGGPTQTRALPKGSPAVNTADNSACPAADQRGVARPQPVGGTCDKGAYERAAHDLSIQKLANASSFTVGEQVVFTLAISNAGPADAPGVEVKDTLPDGLTFVSAQPSQGTCSGGQTVTCSLGTLANGQDADVVIRATVARAGDHTNTATVAGDGTFEESVPSNNSASRTVTGRERPATPEPQPDPCRDTVAPITELKQSRVRVRRGKVHLSGTTYDPDPCASGVNRVLVSLARVKGRHLVNCRFIRSKTRYLLTPSPGMNCQDPVLFLAKGGASTATERVSYSFIYFVDLPDGIYRAQARAFDNAGNKERPTKGRNIRKFYVR